jgi:glutaredoxin
MITIYGAEWCVFCKKAKKLAEDRGLKHEWKDVENIPLYEEMKALSPTSKTIPQIFWNGNYIGGYDAFAIEVENTIGGYGDGKV